MSENVHLRRDGNVLTVTFDRPAQRNAMMPDMYEALHEACATADTDPDIKVLVLRGAGSRAFISGTDINTFSEVRDGAAGIAYERGIERVVNRLEEVTIPTVAAVEGYCVGGGLVIAAVCDLRVATKSSRFGVPIARTLGNCLSMNSMSVLVERLGTARALDMLLRARMLDAAEAHAAGFVAELCEAGALDATLKAVVETLLVHAPLTMWAAKVAAARLRRANLPPGDDFVSRVFGSDDFGNAVAAFRAGAKHVHWSGK